MENKNKTVTKRIVIEGNICCGKTTLINYLINELKDLGNDLNVMDSGYELFNNNSKYNMLRFNFENPQKWTFLVQMNFLMLLNEIQNNNLTSRINIFNRSILSVHNVFNKAYRDNNIISYKENLYLETLYKKLLKSESKEIDLLIFFKSDIQTLLKRSSVNTYKKYIPSLQVHYNNFLKVIKDKSINIKQVYIIDSSKPISELQNNEYKDILNIILEKN